MPNYIPAPNSTFAAWLANFSALLTAAPADYGLTAPDAVIVAGVDATFQAAYTAAADPSTRTAPVIAARDAARAAAETVVRPYAVAVSLNSAVTNEAKLDLGVTVRKEVPTPIPAPVVAPAIALISATPLVQQLQVTAAGSSGKAKPAGATGIEIARSVGTVAATDPAQLAIVGTYTKTPLTQGFGAADQGKIVTYAARYTTRSGPGGVAQKGPWSALASFVVI